MCKAGFWICDLNMFVIWCGVFYGKRLEFHLKKGWFGPLYKALEFQGLE